MNGIENEASLFSHTFARVCDDRSLKGGWRRCSESSTSAVRPAAQKIA